MEIEGHSDVTTAELQVTADNEQEAIEKATAFIEDADMVDLHAF